MSCPPHRDVHSCAVAAADATSVHGASGAAGPRPVQARPSGAARAVCRHDARRAALQCGVGQPAGAAGLDLAVLAGKARLAAAAWSEGRADGYGVRLWALSLLPHLLLCQAGRQGQCGQWVWMAWHGRPGPCRSNRPPPGAWMGPMPLSYSSRASARVPHTTAHIHMPNPPSHIHASPARSSAARTHRCRCMRRSRSTPACTAAACTPPQPGRRCCQWRGSSWPLHLAERPWRPPQRGRRPRRTRRLAGGTARRRA